MLFLGNVAKANWKKEVPAPASFSVVPTHLTRNGSQTTPSGFLTPQGAKSTTEDYSGLDAELVMALNTTNAHRAAHQVNHSQ